MPQDARIIRVALPTQLIRKVDELILSGVGGFATRGEFILDAVQERVVELLFGTSSEVDSRFEASEDLPVVTVSHDGDASLPPSTIDDTRLASLPSVFTIDSVDLAVREGVLFGLHNRDYPSLWVASLLASWTQDGPLEWLEAQRRATSAAWDFGRVLLAVERQTGGKHTALFPTNLDKRKGAESVFREFAIGSVNDKDGELAVAGPLFQWRLVHAVRQDNTVVVALSEAGLDLLKRLDGMTVEEPHQQKYADEFLAHVRRFASGDFWGFEQLLLAIGTNGATRAEVIAHFMTVANEWTENESSTNAAGYVARAREWGLVEPKQEGGKYLLTEYGMTSLASIEGTAE